MKKKFVQTVALGSVLFLSSFNLAFAAGGSVGYGKFNVYRNDQLVSKLSGQNPVEEKALLVCNGKCIIKSEGISLVGADKAELAIQNEADTFKLYVKSGQVDYLINSNARKITFYTPQGTYTVAEALFMAASSSVVKGSVVVTDEGQTEISVTEGRLSFATADGVKVVDANNKLILAAIGAAAGAGTSAGASGAGAGAGAAAGAGAGAAAGAGAGAAAAAGAGAGIGAGALAAGAAVAAATVGAVAIVEEQNDDDDDDTGTAGEASASTNQ